MATLIVRGSVVTAMPSRETEPRAFETDSIVAIITVLKGSMPDQELIVSQRGGGNKELWVMPMQYSLMQPGEEYILFLVENPQGTVSGVKQRKHYIAVGAWSGLFPFRQGRMTVSAPAADGLRKSFEGFTVEQVANEISKKLR